MMVACGLLAVGGVLCVVRGRAMLSVIRRVRAGAPVRSVLLAINLAVIALILINVFSYWGMIVGTASLGLGLCLSVYLKAVQFFSIVDSFVRYSPMSFFMLYMLFGAGEILLRQNPMLVGGGGGGTPALRALYEGYYSINSDGLRDDEWLGPQSAGACMDRPILALGDSFTFGQGVRQHETYVERLEALLQKNPGSCAEVINAGRQGVNTSWEYRYLEETGESFDPKLVLVQFYMNDVRPSIPELGSAVRGLADYLTWPREHSYALFWLRDRFKAIASPERDPFQEYWRSTGNENDPGWIEFVDAIEDFGAWSRGREVPVFLVLFPHAVRPLPPEHDLFEEVQRVAVSAGLPVIDLTGLYDDIEPSRRIVNPIDHHPGPEAHKAAADRIYEFLTERDVLSSE